MGLDWIGKENGMERDQLLQQIKECLQGVYGDRLQGVVLYGSEARGEATQESDVDILVLIKDPVVLGRDLQTTIRALYPLQLELLRPIHATPVDVKAFDAGEFMLYRIAKEEGILLV
mgnify:CR=1 FL=1